MERTNTSATTNSSSVEAALQAIPKPLRAKVIATHQDLKNAYASGIHDACGLRAGKFAEAVLRCVQESLEGSHTPIGARISNFDGECQRLMALPRTTGSDGMRILLPRALTFIYTLRNKRDVGHLGGDVDSNGVDAATAVRIADWCLAELIRNVHTISLEEAQALVEVLAQRDTPEIWSVGGVKRVLRPDLGYRDQVLILLYSENDTAVAFEDLAAWTEHPRPRDLRSKVIMPMHRERLIEMDSETQVVMLSPSGAAAAEAIRAQLAAG